MSKYAIDGATLTAIADAIRAKNGSEDTMLPSEMADLIEAIESGGAEVISGTATVSVKDTQSMSLGAALPESGNYAFFIGGGTYPNDSLTYYVRSQAILKMSDGTSIGYVRYIYKTKSSGDETYNYAETAKGLSVADGTYTGPQFAPVSGMLNTCVHGTYNWYYIAW